MIMPAISIRQPWGWCILHAGKDVENRAWELPHKFIGKPVLLHAGKTIEQDDIEILRSLGVKVPNDLETGGIIGVTVFGWTGRSGSWWGAEDQYNWRIDQSRTNPLPFFPCPGRLNFFTVDYPHEEGSFI